MMAHTGSIWSRCALRQSESEEWRRSVGGGGHDEDLDGGICSLSGDQLPH